MIYDFSISPGLMSEPSNKWHNNFALFNFSKQYIHMNIDVNVVMGLLIFKLPFFEAFTHTHAETEIYRRLPVVVLAMAVWKILT